MTGEQSEGGVTSEDVLAGLNEASSLAGKFEELPKGSISRAAVRDPGGIIKVEEKRAMGEEGDQLFNPRGTKRNGLAGDENGVVVSTAKEISEATEAGDDNPGNLLAKVSQLIEARVLVGVKE